MSRIKNSLFPTLVLLIVTTLAFAQYNEITNMEVLTAAQIQAQSSSETNPGTSEYKKPPKKYKATIRRTAYGVAHIEAEDLGSLGFGEGFAQAEDHLCTIADQIVMVRGERSKYFGRGPEDAHLESDLTVGVLRIMERADEELARQPPELLEWAEGFAAGYNHYLNKTGRDAVPGWCQGAAWVRPITVQEIAAYWKYKNYISYNLASMFTSVQPPSENIDNDQKGALRKTEVDIHTVLNQSLNASNGWALGSDRTENGKGMLLANPHYNWTGSNRFWEKHLRIPGVLDVYGVNIIGAIGVLIGFNDAVGWTHTVSHGFPITLYSLELVPGNPTQYRYGYEVREMTPIEMTIEVLGETEPLKRTLWTSHYGPIIDAGPWKWTKEKAYTLRDATEDNSGSLGHLFHSGRASSISALKEVHAKYQALPNINTIAADAGGAAWFASAPCIPNISDSAMAVWQENIETDSITRITWGGRFMLFDGSDPRFEWQQDPEAGRPGVVPFHRIPQLERTDYVVNSNNTFWLANADHLLEGDYSPLHGSQRSFCPPRTRSNLLHITNASPLLPAGEDGRFNLAELQKTALANRSLTADLLVPELVERCRETPRIKVDGYEVDLSTACKVLADWDHHMDLDSRGAVLFREWITRYSMSDLYQSGKLFEVPVDPEDPIHTPHTLAKSPLALENLARAVRVLESRGIALDVSLGELQYAPSKLPHRIPVHGGYEHEGVLNLMFPNFSLTSLETVEQPAHVEGSPFLTEAGYPILHGTSFIMALEYTDKGPRANAILSYGQSGDPNSEHFLDQTKLFQRKDWRPILFQQKDVAAGTLRKYKVSEMRSQVSKP